MSKLPVASGREAIKAFEKLGYVKLRQRGSHVRLLHKSNPTRHKPLSIPLHPSLGSGLLRRLIRDSGISVEEFKHCL